LEPIPPGHTAEKAEKGAACHRSASTAEVCRLKKEDNPMERTYKKIEVVGVSEKSFAEATQNAARS